MSNYQWGEANRLKKRKPLDRMMLRDQVREYLVDAILNGMYGAGDRIVETRVAQELGVSQGAVREALREMEWMGFLETQPYSGTYVKDFSINDLKDLYPVRASLEALGAELASARLSSEDLDDLERLVDEMVALSEAGDARGMVERNYRFHQTIINASGNEILMRFWGMFQLSYWTTLSISQLNRQLEYLARRHYEIIAALRTRDPEKAARAMHDHISGLVGLLNREQAA